MKPKDLKHPFSWDQRRVLLDDRIWYVPDYLESYDTFTFPGFEAIFGNAHQVNIEYCSGNGTWIVERCQQEPLMNWVAVEKQFVRARKIYSKLKNLNLNNLLVVCGDGRIVTEAYIPNSSVKEVYINFPDPWPKDRHAKHRIVQPSFVSELERILQREGLATIATDDVAYSEQIIDIFHANEAFRSIHPAPFYQNTQPHYGNSFFERLWRSKGRSIRFHSFNKKG